jgi:hypothetical protein
VAVKNFVVQSTGNAEDFGALPSTDELNRLTFRKNNSRSRAFMLALAKLGPQNLTNGAAIDVSEALSAYNKKQFHHIFPQGYLKRTEPAVERNYLLNFCMLAASENNSISDADPHEYLPSTIAALGDRAPSVLASNLMPPSESFDYADATYEQFRNARASLLRDLAEDLCHGLR